MSIWLDTRGRSTLGIGLCGRCSRKMSLDDLHDDPNASGLKVCHADLDDYDPWRLPAPTGENVTLRFARPDVSIAVSPNGIPLENDSYFLINEEGFAYLVPEDDEGTL